MATASRYGGFIPLEAKSENVKSLTKTAAAIYKGDVLYADSDGKVLSVTDDAASTHAQAKLIKAVALEPAAAAATTVLAYLVGKDEQFVVQVDEALATTNIGNNADIVEGTGSNGLSGHKLDASTAATTQALTLKIIDFILGPDSLAATAYQYAVVKFNLFIGDQTGTAGV